MAGLYPDTLLDFANLTLSKFSMNEWVDIALSKQNYLFADRIIQGKRSTTKGGKDLRWKVQTGLLNNFKVTEMYAVEGSNVADITTEANLPWTKVTESWSYDDGESDFQSDDRVTIVNEIKVREHAMYDEFFDGMETLLWSSPASSTETPRKPSGIPFWLQKYTTATPAFQGGNPSGFTAGAGGISSTTVPAWQNWAGQYVEISRSDLISKVIDAMWFTNFKPPQTYAQLDNNKGRNTWEHLTTRRVQGQLEQYLTDVNDNLGPDVARYAGAVVCGGVPVTAVSYLEANDTSDPWYGVNWNQFSYFVKSGNDMMLMPLKKRDLQPTVNVRRLIHWCNFGVWNRRMAGFCLSK